MANLQGHGREKRRRFSRRRRPVELEPLQGLLDRGTFHRCSLGESLPSSALIARRSARSSAMWSWNVMGQLPYSCRRWGGSIGAGRDGSRIARQRDRRSRRVGEPKCEAERSILGHRSSSRRRLDLVHWSDLRDACLDAPVPRVGPVLSASGHHRPRAAGRAKLSRRRTRSEPRLRPRRALERIHKDSATQER